MSRRLCRKAHLEPVSSTLTARVPKGTMPIHLEDISLPDVHQGCQWGGTISRASVRTVIYAKPRNGLWGGDAAVTRRAKPYVEFKAKRIIYRSVPAEEYKHLCAS